MTQDKKNPIRQRIGSRVRELRQEKGLSMRVLAELSGLNKSTIERLENGKFDARIDTLEKLEKVFGKKLDFVD